MWWFVRRVLKSQRWLGGALVPGVKFSLRVPGAELVISALEARTEVHVVSSPQLRVIDRPTASYQVSDRMPVIANDVSFRDTPVILQVTPQIRPTGDVLSK